jgi:hypothetical protein
VNLILSVWIEKVHQLLYVKTKIAKCPSYINHTVFHTDSGTSVVQQLNTSIPIFCYESFVDDML